MFTQSKVLNHILALIMISSSIVARGENPPAIIVEPYVVENYNFYEKFTGIGQVKFTQSKHGIAKQKGTVTYINQMQGNQVAKGDIIILLDSIKERQALIKAEAEYKYAKRALQRDQSLYDKKVISEEIVEESKVALERSNLELVEKSKNLEDFIITAPFDGTLDVITTRVGDEINVNDKLFTVTSPSKKEVIVELPQNLNNRFNDKIKIYSTDIKDQSISGQLIAMSSSLSQSGTLSTKIEFAENTHLIHDSYIKVLFEYNQHSAPSIPEKAVMKNNTGDFVYKITNDNIVEQLYIKTGIRTNGNIEILSDNLSVGDKIVLEGLTKVYDKSAVQFADPTKFTDPNKGE